MLEGMAVEIEKKYRLTAELRSEIIVALGEWGATFRGEEFEENIIFSNADLVAKNSIVRIRQTENRTVLTFKQRIANSSDAKQQTEHETEVIDAQAARTIMESIGLRAVLVYEKRRRTYDFRNVEVVLDELPFGMFMEIEGQVAAIAEAEILLGIQELEVEHETYPGLTAKYGTKIGDIVESRF